MVKINGRIADDVLQDSVQKQKSPIRKLVYSDPYRTTCVVRGDHSEQLKQICNYLEHVKQYSANALQRRHDTAIFDQLSSWIH